MSWWNLYIPTWQKRHKLITKNCFFTVSVSVSLIFFLNKEYCMQQQYCTELVPASLILFSLLSHAFTWAFDCSVFCDMLAASISFHPNETCPTDQPQTTCHHVLLHFLWRTVKNQTQICISHLFAKQKVSTGYPVLTAQQRSRSKVVDFDRSGHAAHMPIHANSMATCAALVGRQLANQDLIYGKLK